NKGQKDKNKIKIIYAGNLGIAYDIPCILEAVREINRRHPNKTEFIIAGVGHYKKLVEKFQNENKNLTYLGRIGYDDLLYHYALSDLGLAQYSKGATQSVTYKFFDYLGASLPILNSLQSEMAQIISDNRIGLNNEPSDSEMLVKNIEKFLNDPSLLKEFKSNALNFTKESGDNAVVYKKFSSFLAGQYGQLPIENE